MASIPCAAYQAGSIHGELRRKHLVKLRSQSSMDATPPASPKQIGEPTGSIFSQIFNKPWLRAQSHSDVSEQQTSTISNPSMRTMMKSS